MHPYYSTSILLHTQSSSSSTNGSLDQTRSVSWNPFTSNRFCVISNRDVQYFKINEQVLNNAVESGGDVIKELPQENEVFSLLSTSNLATPAKCSAWSPEYHSVLALGLQSGKLILDDINGQEIVTEFAPKNLRTCRCISWNQIHTNLIAAGYDKGRNENSTLVWDLEYSGDGATDAGGLTNIDTSSSYMTTTERSDTLSFRIKQSTITSGSTEVISRPLYEATPSEAVTSVSWLPGQPLTLLVGTSFKFIRIYDFREYTSAKSFKQTSFFQAHNRAVYGLKFNPFDRNHFLTYSDDNQIKVWDVRRLSTPIRELSIVRPGNSEGATGTVATAMSRSKDPVVISEVEWSPSRSNILGVLTKAGQCIKLWDLSEPKNKSIQYKISPYKALYSFDDAITGFSFHPTIAQCLLAVTSTGIVRQMFVMDFSRISLSPLGQICMAQRKCLAEISLTNIKDYVSIMRERAIRSVGVDISHNVNVANEMNDQDSLLVWSWFSRLQKLNEANEKRRSEYEFVGIVSLFEREDMPFKAEPGILQTGIAQTEKTTLPVKSYSSPARNIALQICGWKTLPDEINFRSIAIAIFNLELKRATTILTQINQGEINYRFLAYALSGYSEERRAEFKEIFETLTAIDPYLKAALGFLAYGDTSSYLSPELDADDDIVNNAIPYQYVLNISRISLADRVAFAVMYLNDDDLRKYLNDMMVKYIRNGDLEGILLTSIDRRESLDLVQTYVDRTGDVQLACLMMKQVKTTDPLVERWLDEYRDILDRWQMWEERALLDTKLVTLFSETIPPPKSAMVSVKCAFCNQALVHNALISSRGGRLSNFSSKFGNFATRPKPTSCPNCRKPLPKCSICLMSFGSPSQSLGGTTNNEKEYGDLDYCFSWCTKCKHGGHVSHLMQWFKTHHSCAVSDCNCICIGHRGVDTKRFE